MFNLKLVSCFQKADFNWSTKEKGFIISAFFYGYLASPFGGILSVKYGGVVIYGLGIAITGFLTILSPFIIRINIWAYGAIRVLEGIVEVSNQIYMKNLYRNRFLCILKKLDKLDKKLSTAKFLHVFVENKFLLTFFK